MWNKIKNEENIDLSLYVIEAKAANFFNFSFLFSFFFIQHFSNLILNRKKKKIVRISNKNN